MALHIIKLSVGTDDADDLRNWIAHRLSVTEAATGKAEYWHTTRMTPKRRDELLDGGSVYWVIKGEITCRQRLLDIREVTGEDGVTRCRLVLDAELVETRSAPRRPFQGWRYLKPDDAPGDLGTSGGSIAADLERELASLGLL
ncbi:MAG: DUF1489 domain-containing protein [Notoacmeibacter sp.]|nr:DUF1489 domain-containing protein [Notoacmeibacter sp.]